MCLFFYHNIKDNERNLCQDLLTIENTDSDLKVHGLHYANELFVRVRLLQTLYVSEKSKDAYSLSVRVQTTINHISICFLAQAEKGIVQHIGMDSNRQQPSNF